MTDVSTARAELINRQLPEMTLSDGSATSLTPPTLPMPKELSPQERSLKRFAVEGNAIITGGAGALALEGARALLEHGLSGLMLFDIDEAQAEQGAVRLRQEFPSATIGSLKANVTDPTSVGTAVEATVSKLGSVDVLCCFAGVVGCTHAIDMSAAEWRRTLEINTTGEFLCAQAVARQIRSQGTGGSIVLVASMSGHRVNYPQPQSAYNVSKTALLHMAHSLSAEWAVYGIRVNTLSPGYMDTILNEGPGLNRARKMWTEKNPLGRMGTPAELTGPLVLLCSRYGGAYMTGIDLLVDGGASVF